MRDISRSMMGAHITHRHNQMMPRDTILLQDIFPRATPVRPRIMYQAVVVLLPACSLRYKKSSVMTRCAGSGYCYATSITERPVREYGSRQRIHSNEVRNQPLKNGPFLTPAFFVCLCHAPHMSLSVYDRMRQT